MGFALRKQASRNKSSGGAPLGRRLHAWWNGYELRPRPPAPAGGVGETGKAPGAAGAGGGPARDNPNPWSETRLQLAQELWSPGFIVPGGNGYVEKLVSGCNLTAAETMLEIGVGMGGGTRTIIGKFGNYVTGYEPDADLAAAARRHAASYELDDKLEVISTPFDEIALKPGYFRAALLRDVLYTVDDKAGMVGRVAAALKSGESFLILTDFLFDAADSSPELEAWMAAEERAVYPWSEDALTRCLESHGITPRIVADESDSYRAMVIEAWIDYLRSIEGRDLPEGMGRQLEREGEFWTRRVAALESGALKYYRIEAVKLS